MITRCALICLQPELISITVPRLQPLRYSSAIVRGNVRNETTAPRKKRRAQPSPTEPARIENAGVIWQIGPAAPAADGASPAAAPSPGHRRTAVTIPWRDCSPDDRTLPFPAIAPPAATKAMIR